MAVADVHPSVEDLTGFSLGTLDEEMQASIEAHVATCTSCHDRATDAPGDSFVELLRRVHARTSGGANTDVVPAAQMQTPVPLAALAVTDVLAPAESDCPEVPEALPPELARHERYRVVRLLGVGGMGAVYEAEHRVMHKPVALKVIKRAYTASPAARERFRREVRAVARLSHPNIVTTHDAEDAGDTHFLVMEYVEGIDLGRLVQERGPRPVDRACDYIRQAARGLQHAFEQKMVHRDLKPHNLMLTPDDRVKILDFGLACFASEAADATGLTGTGIVLGTVDYIAPEQADNAHQADIRSDIYSLGCTLYHLLAGQPPFPTGAALQKVRAHAKKKPQPLTKLRDDLPEGFMPVLERMMAKNPKHRYQTPAEVAIALARFTKPPQGESQRGPRRRPLLTALVALLLIGLALAGVIRIHTDQGEDKGEKAELVITTESDDVEVVIKQGGELVRVIDTKTDREITLTLRSGTYELELKGAHEGLKLNIDKATLTRGKRTLAKIERVKLPTTSLDLLRFIDPSRDAVVGAWTLKDKALVTPDADHARLRVRYDPPEEYVLRLLVERIKGDTLAIGLIVGKHRANVVFTRGNCGLEHIDNVFFWSNGSLRRGIGFKEGSESEIICTVREDRIIASLDGTNVVDYRGDPSRLSLPPSWAMPKGRDLWIGALGSIFYIHKIDLTPLSSGARTGQKPSEKVGEARRFVGHTGTVRVIAYSPDGRFALSGGEDGILRMWDVATGKEIRRFSGHTGYVLCVAFSPDGRRVLSGGRDGSVRLWDTFTGTEIHRLESGTVQDGGVSFSPDGRQILIGRRGEDYVAALLDSETWKVIRKFELPSWVFSAVFSRDGKRVLMGSDPRQSGSPLGRRYVIRLWDVETGRMVQSFGAGEKTLVHCALSPDGRYVLSGDFGEKNVRLWEVETGKPVREFQGHEDGVLSVAFSPDGRYALSGSRDGTVRLWDVETGKERHCFKGHSGGVWSVAFSPDGRYALSGSGDGTVRLWRLPDPRSANDKR